MRIQVIDMRGPTFQMPDEGPRSLGTYPSRLNSQPSLLRARIGMVLPDQPNNKHIKFRCTDEDRRVFHCKADADGRSIRATEWFSQSLARHLNIAVPDFRIMEKSDGETLFGSCEAISTASIFEVHDFLNRKKANEVGGPSNWFGCWLSRLYALDMFLNNPDRGSNNFVLEKGQITDRLCAIDFADARLEDITSERFPVATSNTVCNGKFLESVHGFSLDSALEMIENIQDIKVTVIEGILGGMPSEWMANDQKLQIREAWANARISPRLSALRTGLDDGSRR